MLDVEFVFRVDDVWDVRPEDASFVFGDFLESGSEKGFVVSADLGDDRDALIVDDVGRVQPAAHAYFDNADLNFFLVEAGQRRGREDLKRRSIYFLGHIACEEL